MRLSSRFILIAAWLLCSALAWGQAESPADRTSLLARLSFTSTSDYGEVAQICFSVDRTGYYRMRRLALPLKTKANAELLQGILTPEELKVLEGLLGDEDFRGLAGPFSGLLRKGSPDTFVAEVMRENSVQRVAMSDAENPFPRSAGRIVRWLRRFKPESAEPLDVSAQDICPSGALQPVRPSTVSLGPLSSSGGSVRR